MLYTKYVNVYAALLDLFVGPVGTAFVTIGVGMVSQRGL